MNELAIIMTLLNFINLQKVKSADPTSPVKSLLYYLNVPTKYNKVDLYL